MREWEWNERTGMESYSLQVLIPVSGKKKGENGNGIRKWRMGHTFRLI